MMTYDFLTGFKGTAKGFTAKPSEMKYSPDGRAVTRVRIGCGGTASVPVIYIDVEAWDEAAVRLNETTEKKGTKVIATGILRENRWVWKGGHYKNLQLIYLTRLEVEVDGSFETIEVKGVAEVEDDDSSFQPQRKKSPSRKIAE